MRKKCLAMLLAVVLAAGLLPGTAFAADDLPDWYFLFAIIKNVDTDCDNGDGVFTHTKYTMTQYEADFARDQIKAFEKYMNDLGVMRVHADVVELDGPVTNLTPASYEGSNLGSYLAVEQAAPLLKAGGIDLNKYDHVTCVASLNVDTRGYLGVTGAAFENGTGGSFINLRNREYVQRNLSSSNDLMIAYTHEFLHFMEQMCRKWGVKFDVHKICKTFYNEKYYVEETYTKIILNQIRGNAETGTGVFPTAWRYSPRVLRSARELTVPDGAASVGYDAFDSYNDLESVVIPGSVVSLEDYAFYKCSGLKSVTIPASVTSIGYAAFWGANIKDVYYTGTRAQWNAIRIGEFNAALTGANIHYSSAVSNPGATTPAFTDVPAWCANEAGWAVRNGITKGTNGSGTTFSPDRTCTDAEILTFLHRAAGGRKAASPSPFTVESYYQDAVDWAYEQGLIGASFRADALCTRAAAVSYIWRARGSGPSNASNSRFTDVPSNANYAGAVSWAVENGVTAGTGDGSTFSPNKTCSRGEIVTLLYRAYA